MRAKDETYVIRVDKDTYVSNSTMGPMPVRIKPWPRHPQYGVRELHEIAKVLESGILSGYRGTPEGHKGGKKVQELQSFFESYLGVKHAVAFNSATAALHAACVCCGVGYGDEVIVSPYTFSSSASCAMMANGVPVFVDIDPEIFCITAENIEKAITPRTKAVIPVHLAGHPCDMDAIMEVAKKYNIKVIEDSAQCLGGTYKGRQTGTIGDIGIYSFNQSKPVSTGEGGMFVTNNDEYARMARAIMNHGEVSDPSAGVVGYNYRMTEMVAAIALEGMRSLDKMNDIRIDLTSYMTEFLNTLDGFTPPVTKFWSKHVFYTYMVKVTSDRISRNDFQKAMMGEGIYFGSGYVTPLYLYPIYHEKAPPQVRASGVNYDKGLCPVAERMFEKELVCTDILRFPATKSDVDDVIKAIRKVLNV